MKALLYINLLLNGEEERFDETISQEVVFLVFMDKIIERYLTGFDEINNLDYSNLSELLQKAEDLLRDAYIEGYSATGYALNDQLNRSYDDSVIDLMLLYEIDGLTAFDRIQNHYEEQNDDAIKKVLDTEYHRMWNGGATDRAKESGAKSKTWMTMLDDKVRETHSYLEGETIGIDDEFYTFDGDHALYPGGFELADNNVNCRCIVSFTM